MNLPLYLDHSIDFGSYGPIYPTIPTTFAVLALLEEMCFRLVANYVVYARHHM